MAFDSSITIAGNVTGDPELRQTTSGKPVVNLTIAVNPREYDKQKNEWVDGEAAYWRCSAFGPLAEHIAESITKGKRVIANGRIRGVSWVDKDSGTKRTGMELRLEDIGLSLQFESIGGRKDTVQPQAQDEWASTDMDTPF